MTLIYPVLFTETNDEKSTVLAYIPDLDGSTEGYGLKDAFRMAKDYMCCMLFDKADYPDSSDISDMDIESSPFHSAGNTFASYVEFDIDEYRNMHRNKTVRRNITLPEWLDEMASKAKINVSAITQEALKQKLSVQ